MLLETALHLSTCQGELFCTDQLRVHHLDSKSVLAVYSAGASVNDVCVVNALIGELVLGRKSNILKDSDCIVQIHLTVNVCVAQIFVSGRWRKNRCCDRCCGDCCCGRNLNSNL